jgi:hypothetical protein
VLPVMTYKTLLSGQLGQGVEGYLRWPEENPSFAKCFHIGEV